MTRWVRWPCLLVVVATAPALALAAPPGKPTRPGKPIGLDKRAPAPSTVAAGASRNAPRTPARPGPPPLPFKSPPPATPLADRTTWARAELAVARDDHHTAAQDFARITTGAAAADASYNRGAAFERMPSPELAIRAYQAYLDASPAAPDRAVVTRQIARLRDHTPTPTWVTGAGDADDPGDTATASEVEAVLVLDGAQVVRAPVEVVLDGGQHILALVTATGYGASFRLVRPGDWYAPVALQIDVRAGSGNVVLQPGSSAVPSGFLTIAGRTVPGAARFDLPPGRYVVRDDHHLCAPFSFEVTDRRVLTYVHLDGHERPRAGGGTCFAVQARRLLVPVPEPTP
ncbi:MAG: hypothetical protein KBG28_10875 [Kofleriaceae bacterium]|nr:hypothetical protein [Kofleriaceae bacterium]